MSSIYIVTGGTRGIGHELVKQLLAAGHIVVATFRSPSEALTTMSAAMNSQLIILKCDLTSAESIKAFGAELAKSVPRIDVLINNAGICTPSPDEDMSNLQPSLILSQLNTNIIGSLLVTQASARLFHSGTKLINISSMVGSLTITKSMPITSVASYSISKVALNMLTLKQALFYTDCIVVALDPGVVKTEMNPSGSNAVEKVATSIFGVIGSLGIIESGSFISWEGKTVGW